MEVVQDSIIPNTVDEWVGLIAQSIVIFGAVSAVFHKVVVVPIVHRLSAAETSCALNSKDIADLLKKTQASEFDRAQLHQDVGRIDALVTRNTESLRAMQVEAHKDARDIVERLARIEANVNLADAMDRLADRLVGVLRAGRDD